MYDGHGHGVPENRAKAVEWHRLAAMQGNQSAKFSLGSLYMDGGRGAEQDDMKAYFWLSLSAVQGFDKAASLKLSIAKKKNPTQIAQAHVDIEKFIKSGKWDK